MCLLWWPLGSIPHLNQGTLLPKLFSNTLRGGKQDLKGSTCGALLWCLRIIGDPGVLDKQLSIVFILLVCDCISFHWLRQFGINIGSGAVLCAGLQEPLGECATHSQFHPLSWQDILLVVEEYATDITGFLL